MTVPVGITFDPALPISAHVEKLTSALESGQVIVVAGETGSGKTTQLPKICVMAGRQRIAHTQPRRIAARSLATRIADELGEDVGETVGFQVRFTRKRSRQTKVTVMTDGILLAQISHDRLLRRYDTIIIDEAHERSLNIDFLLGYLKQLLPKRPDLKVIVTSATIDTARFATHFDDAEVIEVSGRTYPVEIRYRPVVDPSHPDRDQIEAICDAVKEVSTRLDGDALIFCSGEREIRDTAAAIEAMELPFTHVLPLYARLPFAQQQRVFAPHTGRRIVLATNVAETSLTVPGIRYVIDPGFARISRYSARTKVQRLPIEPISQASAQQRAGRCGRVGPGVCLRLYDQQDFAARPEFTEPEILRTNLASVIVKMADAGLGDILDFPFVEPPDPAHVRDGIRLLSELGAIRHGTGKHAQVQLTAVGRKLARLPVDPRLGRMLIEADRLGCLREVLPIVAGLAIPDPRERPREAEAAADAAHRRFWAPVTDSDEVTEDGSDIAALLRLWTYLRDQRKQLSGSAFRRLCRQEYLSFLRVREWQDLHSQLREACSEIGLSRNDAPASLDTVHTAVLSGLLSHIGLLGEATSVRTRGKRKGPAEYLGARGSRFAINPGSSAARTNAELVMAVELVETSRLWARVVAPITADQVEEVGAHLLKRQYSEPHWSARGGQCMAYERVTLLGVPIVAQRKVSYAKIDPVVAREVFISAALVEGQWRTRHHFWARNQAVRGEAEALADQHRRRDLMVDDATIAAFYDARLPRDVVSVAHFDRWWREARVTQPELLNLTVDDLVDPSLTDDDEAFPRQWSTAAGVLPVDYVFDPGSGHDGVTVTVPLEMLPELDAADFSWQVPGHRQEVATELIRGLPKALRTQLVPAPDSARRALAWLEQESGPGGESLPAGLSRAFWALRGVDIPVHAWQPERLPEHLQVRFVVAGAGQPVSGRNLSDLGTSLAGHVDDKLNAAGANVTHPGARDWEFGVLPEEIDVPMHGHVALVDHVDSVGVKVFARRELAHRSQREGLRRLIALTTVDPTRSVVARLSNVTKYALATSPYADVTALMADIRLKAIGDALDVVGDPNGVRDAETFAAVRDAVRPQVASAMQKIVDQVGEVLAVAGEVRSMPALAGPETVADVAAGLDDLIYPGFVSQTPSKWWPRLVVYVRAARRRMEAASSNPRRESSERAVVAALEQEYAQSCARFDSDLPGELREIGWLLQELRVSLFAQNLGTAVRVSEKRIRELLVSVVGPNP